MLFREKLWESCISVAPVMFLVIFFHFMVVPLADMLPRFLVGGVLLIVGLTIFLVGAELGVVPIGQQTGAVLTSRRSLPLMLAVGFFVGFFATVAEPDVHVLTAQVVHLAPDMNSMSLVLMIALGVGFFVSVAMGRTVLRFSLSTILMLCYGCIFFFACFIDPAFFAIALDASGATTGPMTVPFIMAVGLGVASVYGNQKKHGAEEQGFGFIALASVGPIVAMLVMGLLYPTDFSTEHSLSPTEATTLAHQTPPLLDVFGTLVPIVVHEVAVALGPLAVMSLFFQKTLLHLPPVRLFRISVGFVYTFVGLVFFFVGAKGGFMPTGMLLGGLLAELSPWALIVFGLFVGGLVVCAEPAVWVLTEQVEHFSGGRIKRRVMLASLAFGVAFAVALAMSRVSFSFSLWYVILPVYVLAFILTRFCSPLFTALAFDSGGVASGPLASTFILAFALGASQATGGNPATDAFGVIAFIASAPLITIQLLGIAFNNKTSSPAIPNTKKEQA